MDTMEKPKTPPTGKSQGGLNLLFSSVTYEVGSVSKPTLILKGVSGYAMPGQLVALMGPSGCGKTTLLDILSGRKSSGRIQGQILLGGLPPSKSFLRRYAGYVEQQDTLLDTLTVREMLEYQAHLKRPASEPSAVKRALVDDLLERLGLDKVRNTVIGNVLSRGISGGQAKRVNIGIALVTQPKVLFADEPTSGLDSLTADEVVFTIKRMVKGGAKTTVNAGPGAAGVPAVDEALTCICTIHSPSSYSFGLFDRLLLLYEGRVSYFGPTGASLMRYFEGLSKDIPLPTQRANESEAEWIVRATTGKNKTKTHPDRAGGGRGGAHESGSALGSFRRASASFLRVRPSSASGPSAYSASQLSPAGASNGGGAHIPVTIKEETEDPRALLLDAYAASELAQREMQQLAALAGAADGAARDLVAQDPRRGSATTVSTTYAFGVMWKYRSLKNFKSGEFLGPRLGQKFIVAFILATLFWNLGNNYIKPGPDGTWSSDDQAIASSVSSILFTIVIFLGYGAASYAPTLVLERALFLRERSDGAYSTLTYLVHKIVEEMVLISISSWGFTALMFYGINLHGSFVLFTLVYIVGSLLGVLFAYLCAALSPTIEFVNSLLPAVISTQVFFAGFFLALDKIRWFWRWYSYLDPMRYAFSSLMLNQFSGSANPPLFQGGQTTTQYYGIEQQATTTWGEFGILLTFPIGIFLFAWLALAKVNFQRR